VPVRLEVAPPLSNGEDIAFVMRRLQFDSARGL
jgi:hypothetical protein